MVWSLARVIVAVALWGATVPQPSEPTIRVTPEQLRRANLEFAEARIVSERSTISTPGTLHLNPEFTRVVTAPVAASNVAFLVLTGNKVTRGTIVATLRPEGSAPDDPPVALKAEIDGTVVSQAAPVLGSVTEKAELMTIADLTHLLLVVSVPASEGSHLSKGQTVAVAIDGVRERTSGHISALSGRETTAGSVLEVALEVDDPQRRYRAGRVARAQFVSDAAHPPVSRLVIPAEAVESLQERDVVFIPVTDTEFRVRTIAIETKFGSNVYVQSGVQAGDRVVTAGTSLLRFVAVTQTGRQ